MCLSLYLFGTEAWRSVLEHEGGEIRGDHDHAEQNDENAKDPAKLMRAEMLGQLDAEIGGEQSGNYKLDEQSPIHTERVAMANESKRAIQGNHEQ